MPKKKNTDFSALLDPTSLKAYQTVSRQCVKNGATPDEIQDAFRQKVDAFDYTKMRKAGTHDEAMEAIKNGISGYNYNLLRKNDMSHDEVMGVHNKGYDLINYQVARERGMTHNDVRDAENNIPKEKVNTYISLRGYQNLEHSQAMNYTHSDYNPYDAFGSGKTIQSSTIEEQSKEAHKYGIESYVYNYARNCNVSHKDIIDAASRGIDVKDYATGRHYGISHNDLLDADLMCFNLKNSAVNNLESYVQARRNGASHKELEDASRHNISFMSYGNMRNAGIKHDEIEDVLNSHHKMGSYQLLRSSGASHEESMEALGKKIDPYDYHNTRLDINDHAQTMKTLDSSYNPWDKYMPKQASARYKKVGNNADPRYEEDYDSIGDESVDPILYSYCRKNLASHNEILDALKNNISLYSYGLARAVAGVNHKQCMEAYNIGIDDADYAHALFDSRHDDIIDAASKHIPINAYSSSRNAGATHNDVLEAHEMGMPDYPYAFCRQYGATHDEALDAYFELFHKGSLHDYAKNRWNVDHATALRNQIKDYNPYDAFIPKSTKKWSS